MPRVNQNTTPDLPVVVSNASAGSKPTVNNVHLLDRSQSMTGGKYNNALAGINEEISILKKDDTVNYTQTFIEFDFAGGYSNKSARLVEHCFLTPMDKVPNYIKGAGASGGTPLYQAVGEILERLLVTVPKGEKVLVKIFTDGEDLHSKGKFADRCVLARLIEEVEGKGYTVTFVGTQYDTDSVIRDLKIKKSNTLTHDNTAASVMRSFKVTADATMAYSKSVARGEDVKENFYSKSVVN